MRKDEVSPQERFAYVSTKLGSNKEHAQRLYEYASCHWLSYSTPVLAYGRSRRGLPVSCYLNYIDDTTDGLIDNLSETNKLSTLGGGVGVGIGIRQLGGKSAGVMSHVKTYDAAVVAYKQGDNTRRGSYAMYLDINHPEIVQFLEMRKPTGDQNFRAHNLNHAINVSDKFMRIIESCMLDPNTDDDWELIDPHTKEVTEVLSAKWLWEKILETRVTTGEPYLHFIDTANNAMPEFMKRHGHVIRQSNLCVAPETLVFTDKGHVPIVELEGKEVNVWNGKQFSKTTVFKTAENVELLKVTLDSGESIECTPEHNFYLLEGKKVPAKELHQGDLLEVWEFEGTTTSHAVSNVEYTRRISDTYCFTEPNLGKGVFNGILTGQCSEISLPTSPTRTAICCLSSLNLAYYDEWKDNKLFIRDVLELLDNTLDVFIEDAPARIHRAVESAVMERNVGIGMLGLHAYLQSKMIPFEGVMAKIANRNIAKSIREQIDAANTALGTERGEAPDAVGTGRRCCYTQAIAPNASSSIIMGNTSPSTEPYRSNVYRQDTLSGSSTHFNKMLERLIREKETRGEVVYSEVKKAVILAQGSIQDIECFTELEKAVFKTATEIDQRWIIELAADRQEFIDQSQSVIVFILPNTSIKYLHTIHFLAWKQKLKSLYYCRSEKQNRVTNTSTRIVRERIEAAINIADVAEGNTCVACEG